MDWQESLNTILVGLLSGGVGAAVSGTFFGHWLAKRFDRERRLMDRRQEIYSAIHEALAGLYDTASPEQRNAAVPTILRLFREVQMWGSKKVVDKFTEFLKLMDKKYEEPQEVRNRTHKELVLEMRRDLSGQKDLNASDVEVYGKLT